MDQIGLVCLPFLTFGAIMGVVAHLVVRGVRGREERRGSGGHAPFRYWVILSVVTTGGLVYAPFVAAHLAERGNLWVDHNHDGFLDGFTNGSYDWLDVNGGACFRWWVLFLFLIAVGFGLTAWVIAAAGHRRVWTPA